MKVSPKFKSKICPKIFWAENGFREIGPKFVEVLMLSGEVMTPSLVYCDVLQ
jgi:hypothetical protein